MAQWYRAYILCARSWSWSLDWGGGREKERGGAKGEYSQHSADDFSARFPVSLRYSTNEEV